MSSIYEYIEGSHQFMKLSIKDTHNMIDLPNWVKDVYHEVLAGAFVATYMCSLSASTEYQTLGYYVELTDDDPDTDLEHKRDVLESDLSYSDTGGGAIAYVDPNKPPKGIDVEFLFEITPQEVWDELGMEGEPNPDHDAYEYTLWDMAREACN